MENDISIVLFGLGPMGKLIAKGILEKKGVKIVGAVDISKEIVGKDLAEVLDLPGKFGVEVTDDPETLLSKMKPDISVLATSSYLEKIYPQIETCVKAGVNVISTCEELTFPYYRHPQKSRELDWAAKENGVTVLGTGINPGYLMDALPIVITGACNKVSSIKVTRMMDSSKRRIPYQRKIGTGLTPAEFRKLIDQKKISGHVGLEESIAMIASALGWDLDEIEFLPPEPVIADKEIVTPYKTVKPGEVAGLKSIAHGHLNGKPVITMEFVSHAGVKEEYDSIVVDGIPRVEEKIIGGINGDVGTVDVIVNMIPKVLTAEPGLVTMKDLPLPSAATEDFRIYL